MKMSRFKVEQQSAFAGDGLWNWSIWLDPAVAGASLDEVKWVRYGLHPCYLNPNRVIRQQAGGFRLDMSSAVEEEATWGSFTIRATIALKDGTREKQTIELELSSHDGLPAPRLLPIADSADYETCKRIYKLLKKKSAFGYALEVLAKAEKLPDSSAQHDEKERIWITQQKALCTYKDPSLPNDTRLQRALQILQAAPCLLNLTDCTNPETLGLGGAVYKRLWELDQSHRSLELAISYYRRSYEHMLLRPHEPDYDGGAFAGINLGYLYEVMASELGFDVDPDRTHGYLREAQKIRKTLVENLTRLQNLRFQAGARTDWWIAATLLEAYIALASVDSEFEKFAMQQARLVLSQRPTVWERQSTGQQLLHTIRLHKHLWPMQAGRLDAFFRRIAKAAFGNALEIIGPMFEGKLGLALSGGGFRASLFHVGVLARMAELDLLRHVEVISCVSGGSIVGAHYYLLLRELLQRKADGDIDRDDYLELIDKLLDQFLAGVQKNIRMRVAASWFANARMIFQPSSYSRTQRLGELYEKHLYKLVQDGEQDNERWLNEAFIIPKKKGEGWEDSFSPKLDNWHRSNKAPMLALNATSLNTGRNWQFTASWMGEPLSYGTSIDATERLQPVYYSEAPEALQQMRLGHAVAASSCVPALFTPIVVKGLYPDRIVRLVDGGVHDNQGTRALLDQDCDVLIVSDASGQMASERNPAHSELGVFGRTNSVLQARIRIAQHQEVQARERFGLIKRITFLHLRKRIEAPLVVAEKAEVADASLDKAAPATGCTEYGVSMQLQSALAEVRTDLDSFTDIEALALMYSGYAMADKYLDLDTGGMADERLHWRFMDIEAAAQGRNAPRLSFDKLLRHVRVAKHLAFKAWLLHPALKMLGLALVVLAGVGSIWGLWKVSQADPPAMFNVSGAVRTLLYTAAAALLGLLLPTAKKFFKGTRQALQPAGFVMRIAFGVIMSLAGSWLCKFHLWTFDRVFLKLGRFPKSKRAQARTVIAGSLREGTIVYQHTAVSHTAIQLEADSINIEVFTKPVEQRASEQIDVQEASAADVPLTLARDIKVGPPLEFKQVEHAAAERSSNGWKDSDASDLRAGNGGPHPATAAPAMVSTEDKVQFTVRHPKELRPNDWRKFLAYMHLASALAAVRENARDRLGASTASTGEARGQATLLVARGVEVTVIPELPGCRFNPRQASFSWLKDWHAAEFEVQADPQARGYELDAVVNGRVQFYIGPLLIGSVPIWAGIVSQASVVHELQELTEDPYQKIFPSYSHLDTDLVEQMEKVYEAVGMQYLRDVRVLRSGQQWNPALLKKIEEADIFQLFWSEAASQSAYVQQEWRHALQQGKSSFIRPLYWTKPMPIPPQELNEIQFSYYEP